VPTRFTTPGTGIRPLWLNGGHARTRTRLFFRDWYAGRKFAEYAHITDEAARLIATHEATLTRKPNTLSAQLALAYLYEARGDSAKARALWTKIDP
jgi:hypothetical protein